VLNIFNERGVLAVTEIGEDDAGTAAPTLQIPVPNLSSKAAKPAKSLRIFATFYV
jgi:hypothetical protein